MAETIVMIHGMWAGGWYWDNYKAFFTKKGVHCMTPTLRHHDTKPGDPPHPDLASTSILDFVSDLKEITKKLDKLPIIMGHSMGALIAQILCTQIKCKALVLLAPAAPRGISSLSFSTMRTFWSCFTTWAFWRKPIIPTFGEIAYGAFQLMHPTEQKRMYDKYIHESGKAATEIGFSMFDKSKATEVDGSRITCPTLILSGVRDRIIPQSAIKKIYKKYRHVATLKIYPNHAHWLLGESGWEAVAADIDEWLRNNLS